jgi:hypothetical protein
VAFTLESGRCHSCICVLADGQESELLTLAPETRVTENAALLPNPTGRKRLIADIQPRRVKGCMR